MQKLIASCFVALLLFIAGLAVFHSMARSANSNLATPLTAAPVTKPDDHQATIVLQAAPAGSLDEVGSQHSVLIAGSVSGILWRPHRSLQ